MCSTTIFPQIRKTSPILSVVIFENLMSRRAVFGQEGVRRGAWGAGSLVVSNLKDKNTKVFLGLGLGIHDTGL